MIIAIEAQRIFRKNKHGMDFVALETIKEIQHIDKTNEYYIFVKPGEDRCLENSPNFHIVELKCPSYPLWEQIALPLAVKKIHADLLHCTSNTAPIFCSVPLIVTLHDIIFLEKRQNANKSIYQNMGWYYRKLVVPIILKKCKKIITVSNYEKEHIIDTLKLNKESICAIYNGYNNHFKQLDNINNVIHKYIKEDNFLFFLGNTDPKKNVPRTLKAYSLYLKKSKIKLPLIIADIKEDILYSILKEQNIEEIGPKISIPGYILNTDLPYIYNGAFAFIYTSLRESFGIPILEAMACGTPIITSNTSAMPEIAGKDGILVDPFDANSIADKILELEEDKNYYEEQKNYGLNRVKEFSWNTTSIKLLEIYKHFKKD